MTNNVLLRALSSTPAKIQGEEEKDILCKSSESEATSTDGNDLKNYIDNATATMMTSCSTPSCKSNDTIDGSSNHKEAPHHTTQMMQQQQDKNRLFWLIRILYLSYYASTGSLVPYLPVYYHSLGHGGHVIGVLSALRPFINFLVAPLWGMVADYTQNTLGMLRIAAIGSVVGYLSIGLAGSGGRVTYLIVSVIVTSIFYAPVKSLMDSMVLERLSAMATTTTTTPNNDCNNVTVQDQPTSSAFLKPKSSPSNKQNEKNNGTDEFGKLRLWGPIGFGVGCSIAGTVVTNQRKVLTTASTTTSTMSCTLSSLNDIYTNQTEAMSLPSSLVMSLETWIGRYWTCLCQSLTGYSVLFLIFAVMSIPIITTIMIFPSKPVKTGNNDESNHGNDVTKSVPNPQSTTTTTTKSKDMIHGMSLVLRNGEALVFFFLVFIVGINYGAVETFCYVRMREVGATGQQIGLSRLLSAIAGTPMFWFSGRLTKLVSSSRDDNDAGANQVLILSLMGFSTRFAIYALIRTPLEALPAEAIRGITFAAFYSTASTYAHRISPPGLNSTMLMIVNSLYGGLGQSLGSMLAGKVQSQIGTVQMFLAILCADLAFVSLLVLSMMVTSQRRRYHASKKKLLAIFFMSLH